MFYWFTFLIVLIVWTWKSGKGAKVRPARGHVPYKGHESHITVSGTSDPDDVFLSDDDLTSSEVRLHSNCDVNPATGLIMINGMIDSGGNPYGISLDSYDMHSSMDTELFEDSLMSDSTMSSDSLWDDSFMSDSFSSFDSNWDDSW